jgi:hypothetical protein
MKNNILAENMRRFRTKNLNDEQLNEGIKQWVIPFAMAGAIALGIAHGVSNTNDRKKWEAAYEKIKIEHPIEAEKIHDLLIKWDNALGPKPEIIQLKKQIIGQDLDKLIKSIELDDADSNNNGYPDSKE